MQPTRIQRIAAEAKRLRELTAEQRQAYLREAAKAQQKRNCAFCRKYPDQCRP